MKAVEKVKETGKKFWETGTGKTVIGGVMVLGSAALGYVVGRKISKTTFNCGMAALIKEEPEIEILMLSGLEKIKLKNK